MDKTKDTRALLSRYLKELLLSTIRKSYEDMAIQAQQESLSYQGYLLELVELECTNRRNNRIERNLKASRIARDKNIDNFDLKKVPGKVVQQVRTLLEGSFLDRKENILAFGNPGSGKTHLLCAIGQELIRRAGRYILQPVACWCRIF